MVLPHFIASAPPRRRSGAMTTRVRRSKREDEFFLGYRIRKLEGLYIAVPLEWAGEQGETLVARDLPTLREEIRRWWYRVGD